MPATILSISLIALFLAFAFKKKQSKLFIAASDTNQFKTLPLCTCKKNLQFPIELSKKQSYIIQGQAVSFTVCQCLRCGGIFGCPLEDFNHFIKHAPNSKKHGLLNSFYEKMEPPL
ncbi:hypothetical protein [Maridesulfovibrio salexigens]|uniref:hypothetical protein n=1 Tax=Maridesulfovibrio salexigens TaxID=880 RepID=UPI0005A033F8|nr:hypothetical protein [Maridesulfovibrio salexigens]